MTYRERSELYLLLALYLLICIYELVLHPSQTLFYLKKILLVAMRFNVNQAHISPIIHSLLESCVT